jgi:hypothetical protein
VVSMRLEFVAAQAAGLGLGVPMKPATAPVREAVGLDEVPSFLAMVLREAVYHASS